jgi:hypothetical protein
VSLEKKRLLAVHEAGHIVLAHLFPRFDWHAFSQLLPGGKVRFLATRMDFCGAIRLRWRTCLLMGFL